MHTKESWISAKMDITLKILMKGHDFLIVKGLFWFNFTSFNCDRFRVGKVAKIHS
jgi:hypothetical protein